MLFNSVQFLFFFPVVTGLYFLLPLKYRWLLLLVASCFFYMAFIPAYILILALLILIDYFAGIWIENSKDVKQRKLFLILSIAANVGLLGFFKYFNFFNANLAALARAFDWNYSIKALSMALPIGLSFHTFQSMSYTIEVYRGNKKAERRFLIYALYVMFYPQLVAGPIERPRHLLPQFDEEHRFDLNRAIDGISLMLWGFFKKVVIADRLALVVNQVYGHPLRFHGTAFVAGTVAFAIQIYCDFSGYTDIAVGAAQVMGISLVKNFNRPYHSTSVSEFWRRWHISLSTWFRDYVYISLGGNRVSKLKHTLNLIIVFLLSGFWHGANWTFIVWGGLHGIYLVVYLWTQKIREGLSRMAMHSAISVAFTFFLVCFAWIFFRADSISDSFYIAKNFIGGMADFLNPAKVAFQIQPIYFPARELAIALGAVAVMEIVHLIQRKGSLRGLLRGAPVLLRLAICYAFALCIFTFGVFNGTKFIYFQF